MLRWHFEDLTVGLRLECAPHEMTRDAIIAFAKEYDAQPFHIDEEAAKASFFGGLVASGWHTASLVMRAIAERFLLDSSGLGAPGVDELKWLRPVRAGDVITPVIDIIDRKESRSRPEMGLVRMRITTSNQRGEPVMTQENWVMFGRRAQAM